MDLKSQKTLGEDGYETGLAKSARSDRSVHFWSRSRTFAPCYITQSNLPWQ